MENVACISLVSQYLNSGLQRPNPEAQFSEIKRKPTTWYSDRPVVYSYTDERLIEGQPSRPLAVDDKATQVLGIAYPRPLR